MHRGVALGVARFAAPRSVPSLFPVRWLHHSSKRTQEVLATAAKLPDAEPIPTKKRHDQVTINDILERRAKAGRLVAGVAAYCDSDMFKAPVGVYFFENLRYKNTS